MIRSRSFVSAIALSLLVAPLVGKAQPTRKVYRIGVLETTPQSQNAANVAALRQGFRDLGYVEGQNLVMEYRSADGHLERFPELAAELVRLKVDLIVTRGTPAALAAKNAGTLPVVMASSGDPLGSGLVASLAHPGGNITGLSADATEIGGKRLQLLKQLLPGLTRIGGLFNMGNPVAAPPWREVEKAVRTLGLHAHLLECVSRRICGAHSRPRRGNAPTPSLSDSTRSCRRIGNRSWRSPPGTACRRSINRASSSTPGA